MDTIHWLMERIKTYRLLLGELEWEKGGYERELEEIDAIYAAVVARGDALVRELIEHYELLKGQGNDGLSISISNGQ